jgi:pimeloyl-ACP methyl ester carboxylesterase
MVTPLPTNRGRPVSPSSVGFWQFWTRLALLILVPALFLAGCATPVGVRKVGIEQAYLSINASALTGTTLSPETKVVLHRFNLLDRYGQDPATAITLLNDKALQDPRRDLRYALAEMCFLYGKLLEQHVTINGRPTGATDYYLLAAVYAYYYLLGPSSDEPIDPYDHRFQIAASLYNLALGKGLATGPDGRLEFHSALRHLPVGNVAITIDAKSLPWPLEDFINFLPADAYTIYGLTIRNRVPGLGAPLIAVHKNIVEDVGGPVIPLTAFLRVDGTIQNLNDKSARATLEIHSGFHDPTVKVDGKEVQLETDTTTPLAYRLKDASLWSQLGPRRFLSALGEHPRLIMIQPYTPGRIPVVFIHGTASSPLWWAEMFNTLSADPVLRDHFQFWFYMYNSSLRVASSAATMREILTSTVKNLDPEGKDPALHEMVLVGHSQGGLLAKMSVVRTGDTLWDSLSKVSFNKLRAPPDVKNELKRELFFEPLPFVKRVIFIATPHRGSFRASSWVRYMIRRMVTLPGDILTTNPAAYVEILQQTKLPPELRTQVLTSVDSMSPDNPVLKALASIPVSKGIKDHSIIAVLGEGDPTKGNDGVVKYSSAHLEGVESEFIVRDQHSCQSNPLVIEEVRRILLVHLASIEKTTPRKEGP